MQVVISGAGIGGLSLAAGMLRAGHQVHLVERSSQLRSGGAGIVLSANATGSLRLLGVEFEGIGRPLMGFRIATSQGRVLGSTGGMVSPEPSIAVTREALHCVLAQAAGGATLHLGDQVVDLQEGRVTLSGGHSIEADLLVGADGIQSGLRQLLGGLDQPQVVDSGYRCWRALVPSGVGEGSEPVEYWGRGVRAGIVPVEGDQLYLFLTMNNRQSLGLEEAFSEFPEPVRACVAAALDSEARPIQSLSHHQWQVPGAVLLGDAAHAFTPNMGQGAAMAIEDALVLLQCLEQPLDHAIATYIARRSQRVKWVADSSDRLGKVAQWQSGLGTALRDGLMGMAPKSAQEKVMTRLWEGSPAAQN
jgi:2-heptyl-3-hydroxy-4(1H)-quinolone synthase